MNRQENRFAAVAGGNALFTALLFLALALAWTAMSPCLDNGFINWDETEYIIRNPKIKSLSPESVKTIFSTSDLKMYSPLSTFSYALEYRFAGLNPRIYHATSLALHLADTALVMLLARLLLGGDWAPFFVALLFGVHPAHVESVAWAAERKDVLYAFFYLASLIAYALRLDGARTYFLSLALFACALLSKPMAATLPAALLLVDYLKSGRIAGGRWLDKMPFFILAGIWAFALLRSSGGLDMHWAKRLAVPFYNMGFYLYTLAWPFNLSAMYVSIPGGRAGFCAIAAGAAALILLLAKYCRRDREIIFGAAFFGVTLLPVLQFFPFGPVISADRYTYLSSTGVFMAGAAAARRIWRSLAPAQKSVLAICAAAAVFTLATAARVRCAVWKDGVSLWSDTLRKQPGAAAALVNLCGAYLQADMNREAQACLSRAIQMYPGNDDNYYNSGVLAVRNKQFDEAEKQFARTLNISPCHAPALNNTGNIRLLKGDAGTAFRYYTLAAQCDGAYAPAWRNLGNLALSKKDAAAAARYYEKTLSADPSDAETRILLNALRKP